MYQPIYESVKVLVNDVNSPSYGRESKEIKAILEDGNSPITRKYHETLYKSVLDKAHIDFGGIPKSAGNIRSYVGYPGMCETLTCIQKLAEEDHAMDIIKYVKIVQDAIRYIEQLSSTFQKGFTTKTEYVALEYNIYVYTCVEATTALINTFVEYIKSPDQKVMKIELKNTKLRADEFYFTQLNKFNKIQDTMGIDYRKMLEGMCTKGKENFLGTAEIIGVATVAAVAASIVPITRELIFQLYKFRGKLSDHLETQAHFLEMNKACIESNDAFTEEKKHKILSKQSLIAKKLMKLSDAIRVKSAKSILDSKKELEKDNKMLTIDNLRDEVSNSPFEIL